MFGMNAVIELEWRFSPPDYFEEPIEISRQDYTMTIADGQAQAKIDSAVYEAKPGMREELHNALNGRFLGVQLLTHRAYELSYLRMSRVHPGGRREMFCELETGRHVFTGSPEDFQVTKDGNVIADSKRDRVKEKKSLAELIACHCAKDTVLASLLRSHAAAVRDPNNELVHLYEIPEALSTTKFGGQAAAQTALGISRTQWSRFGRLCNDEPLRQGRHRGKTGGALRDATESELIEARGIAKAMIEAYLQYLEASARSSPAGHQRGPTAAP